MTDAIMKSLEENSMLNDLNGMRLGPAGIGSDATFVPEQTR